jgi:LPS O-antigen subunit length determinant protein (WzzB/FepE family)
MKTKTRKIITALVILIIVGLGVSYIAPSFLSEEANVAQTDSLSIEKTANDTLVADSLSNGLDTLKLDSNVAK